MHIVATLVIAFLFILVAAFLIIRGASHHTSAPRVSSDTAIIERAVIDKAKRMCEIVESRSPSSPTIDLEAELAADERVVNPLSDSATQKTIHLKAEQIRRLSGTG